MPPIRASEIGEYVYCHRAWWLRHVQGYSSANVDALAEGAAAHAGHGHLVSLGLILRALALLLFAAALLVILSMGLR